MYLHYIYRRFFVISKIIKGKVSIISWSQRLRPTMLTETLLVVDIMKNQVQQFLLYTNMSKKSSLGLNTSVVITCSFPQVLSFLFPWVLLKTCLATFADLFLFSAGALSSSISSLTRHTSSHHFCVSCPVQAMWLHSPQDK